ncbi:LOW QUALITY PROTEIN: uncharacterized protein LOC136020329 [Lathamus discolor]|uniref:LOW QUALITY PROTEIN: uncharacterized protein LOC136020329 n=1 Tax=Lathamus discolor TaxID=678569 RepID=UPI0032B7AA2B
MLSTKKHGTNILTIKEILENVFVAVPSSHTHPSPVRTYYMDSNSLCAVKQSESLSSCGKPDLHSLTQGISDLSLICFCKPPNREAAFDLSTLPGELHSRAGCLMDALLHNTSTPCKKEEHSKALGSLLSKSTELSSDLSTPGKLPAPTWEIPAIRAPLDISLSLDASTEELRFLGCSNLATPCPETSLVIPLSWPGAFRRPPALTCTSDTPDAQLKYLSLSLCSCIRLHGVTPAPRRSGGLWGDRPRTRALLPGR